MADEIRVADEIRIVRGRPTDEELAAIVGVLYATATAAAAAQAARADEPQASRWARSARPSRRLGTRGRDAWRASTLPGRH